MPFLRLSVQPAMDASARKRLAERLTELMATELSKKAELTSVLIDTVSGALWTVGGRPTASTAFLEAAITAGTNSDAEKSAFVAAAFRLLKAELPELDPIVYVVINELPAENWGYDGRTQAARRVAVPDGV